MVKLTFYPKGGYFLLEVKCKDTHQEYALKASDVSLKELKKRKDGDVILEVED